MSRRARRGAGRRRTAAARPEAAAEPSYSDKRRFVEDGDGLRVIRVETVPVEPAAPPEE